MMRRVMQKSDATGRARNPRLCGPLVVRVDRSVATQVESCVKRFEGRLFCSSTFYLLHLAFEDLRATLVNCLAS